MAATWEALWGPLLLQARTHAQSNQTEEVLGPSAASIILARTAWEAFAAEFIAWRQLPEDIKALNHDDTVERIYSELGQPSPKLSGPESWMPMRRVNQIRNALI